MRIAIIGYSCSGKSTLAKRLSKEFDLPLLYLDTVHWKPNWNEREDNESCEVIGDFMDEHESWVIDGNYKKLLHERRMEEADYIVFMDFPARICMKRAKQRFKEYEGRTRESITYGCDERLDSEFKRWILHDGRDRYKKAAYERIGIKYKAKFVRCNNDADVEAFVEKLKHQA